jgi:prepilin peptidase CpaA
MLTTVMLLAFALVAAVTDVFRKKIYNWNTYTGMAAALALSAVGGIWLAVDPAAESWLRGVLGWLPLSESLGGLLACGGLMVLCFAVFPGIGGGDVKLVAMLGAMMGWEKGIEAVLWTFVLAACFGLIVLVWRVGPLATVARVARLAATCLRLPWLMALSEEERQSLKPPIFVAPSALAAVVIVRFGLIPT